MPATSATSAQDVRLSRRAFLSGAVRPDGAVRPPGARAGVFTDLCRHCDLCVAACPEGVLSLDAGGRPLLDPTLGACTFCGACAQTCPTGALDAALVDAWPWRAAVSDACLSLNGVNCRACQDACDAAAIRFAPMTGGRARPVIDPDRCTGCNGCAAPCAVGAIRLVRSAPPPAEAAS